MFEGVSLGGGGGWPAKKIINSPGWGRNDAKHPKERRSECRLACKWCKSVKSGSYFPCVLANGCFFWRAKARSKWFVWQSIVFCSPCFFGMDVFLFFLQPQGCPSIFQRWCRHFLGTVGFALVQVPKCIIAVLSLENVFENLNFCELYQK